jgi:flagellar hook-associated protein 2
VDVHSDTDALGSTGIFTAGLADSGVDVAGTIDGLAASGAGRALSAVSGNAKGLALEVRAGSDEVDPGGTSLGNAVVSLGTGEQMFRTLEKELGSNTGSLRAERSGIRASDQLLQDRIDSMNDRLVQRQALLTRQFTRADEALRRMQGLTQSLSSMLP